MHRMHSLHPAPSAPGGRWRCLSYYVQRARLNLALLDQLDLVGRTGEMARTFGIDFFSGGRWVGVGGVGRGELGCVGLDRMMGSGCGRRARLGSQALALGCTGRQGHGARCSSTAHAEGHCVPSLQPYLHIHLVQPLPPAPSRVAVLSRGSQYRVESMMLRLAHTQNYIVLSASREQVPWEGGAACQPHARERRTLPDRRRWACCGGVGRCALPSGACLPQRVQANPIPTPIPSFLIPPLPRDPPHRPGSAPACHGERPPGDGASLPPLP